MKGKTGNLILFTQAHTCVIYVLFNMDKTFSWKKKNKNHKKLLKSSKCALYKFYNLFYRELTVAPIFISMQQYVFSIDFLRFCCGNFLFVCCRRILWVKCLLAAVCVCVGAMIKMCVLLLVGGVAIFIIIHLEKYLA